MKFEYCECGCKGYEANAGQLYFWIYWDLKKSYHLHEGHGWTSPKVGTYPSFKAADAKATDLAKAALKKMKKDLKA